MRHRHALKRFAGSAEPVAQSLSPSDRMHLSAGEGAKGARLHDWAYCELAGLDHHETRSWHGWHRHVSLAMLAFAMLAVIRHRTNAAAPPS